MAYIVVVLSGALSVRVRSNEAAGKPHGLGAGLEIIGPLLIPVRPTQPFPRGTKFRGILNSMCGNHFGFLHHVPNSGN